MIRNKKEIHTNVIIKPEYELHVFKVNLNIKKYDGRGYYRLFKDVQKTEMQQYSEIKKYCNSTCSGLWGYSNTRDLSQVIDGDLVNVVSSRLFVAYEEYDILALQLMFDVKIFPRPMWKSDTLFTIFYTGDMYE
jgi:hypothetical protein